MAKDIEEFKNDPEANEDSKKYRLPFALCKKYGIPIQDWWTPRDAWNALKSGGTVSDVSEEYKDYYRQKKKERQKEYAKKARARAKKKQQQLSNPLHNPDKNYKHENGKIAGVAKGKAMDFKQADSGNCNPFYNKGLIGYYTNCQTCVAVYVARRQGYDVRALPNLNNKNIYMLSMNTSLAYADSNGKNPKLIHKRNKEKTVAFLENHIKPGEIFSLEYSRRGAKEGHIIIAEKQSSGELFLYDPQINKTIQKNEIGNYIVRNRAYDIGIMNLTNVKINEDFCDSIMKRS